MTQHEFETRTKMTISSKEYSAIEEVYMNSDLDKDEFCKMWVKMNKTRVEKAKAERKHRDEICKVQDIVLFRAGFENGDELTAALLSWDEIDLFERVGLKMEYSEEENFGMRRFKRVYETKYELHNLIEKIFVA